MNISSLIVDARPEAVVVVQHTLDTWPGVQVHAASAEGKLIVTLETDSDDQTTGTFARINALQGVMSVSMVYHQY